MVIKSQYFHTWSLSDFINLFELLASLDSAAIFEGIKKIRNLITLKDYKTIDVIKILSILERQLLLSFAVSITNTELTWKQYIFSIK